MSEVSINIREKSLAQPVTTTNLEFPSVAWRGIFRNYLDMVAPTTEAPNSFHFATFLQVFGCTLGRKLHVYHAGRLYPNFFTCKVGRSGLARKDTAGKLGMTILGRLHSHSDDDVSPPFKIIWGIRSYEGLLDELRKANTPEEWFDKNWQFHHRLYRNANSPILKETIENLWGRLSPYLHIYVSEIPNYKFSNRCHQGILQGVKEKDPRKVSRWLRSDLKSAGKLVAGFLAAHETHEKSNDESGAMI